MLLFLGVPTVRSDQSEKNPHTSLHTRESRGRGSRGQRGGRGDGDRKGRGRREGERNRQQPPLPRRGASQHREGHAAREREEETAEEETAEEEEEEEEKRGRDGETPRGAPAEVTCMGRGATPLEENSDLQGSHPERTHLLMQGVYGYFLHHNDKQTWKGE